MSNNDGFETYKKICEETTSEDNLSSTIKILIDSHVYPWDRNTALKWVLPKVKELEKEIIILKKQIKELKC